MVGQRFGAPAAPFSHKEASAERLSCERLSCLCDLFLSTAAGGQVGAIIKLRIFSRIIGYFGRGRHLTDMRFAFLQGTRSSRSAGFVLISLPYLRSAHGIVAHITAVERHYGAAKGDAIDTCLRRFALAGRLLPGFIRRVVTIQRVCSAGQVFRSEHSRASIKNWDLRLCMS